MKKVLLSVLALSAGLGVMAQGISPTGAYDDFKKASADADEYSIVTTEKQCAPNTSEDAYMGIFTYSNKDVVADGFGLTVSRNMDAGQLDLNVIQLKGKYEPFGFIFGTYCVDGSEKDFTLDLSKNAIIDFSVKVNTFTDFVSEGGGTPTNDKGVQIKIQATDINGVSLVFDKKSLTETKVADNAWKYEIGVSGDGSQPSNNFLSGSNSLKAGESVHISYNLKDAVPGNDDSNAPATDGREFDYSKVAAIKITFANANKDTKSGYDPYKSEGSYTITNFKLGSLEGDEVATKSAVKLETAVYPNPATSVVNFGRTLTNVSVYNSNGILVETLNSASSINVESFKAGVYLINSTEGSTRFVVK
jgi:hypothetical protein